jgi:hypothetical protein
VREGASYQLDFDPLVSERLSGWGASVLAPVVDAVGFGAARRNLRDDRAKYRYACMLSAFALVERVTGVGMTEDLLESSTYLLTSVPR